MCNRNAAQINTRRSRIGWVGIYDARNYEEKQETYSISDLLSKVKSHDKKKPLFHRTNPWLDCVSRTLELGILGLFKHGTLINMTMWKKYKAHENSHHFRNARTVNLSYGSCASVRHFSEADFKPKDGSKTEASEMMCWWHASSICSDAQRAHRMSWIFFAILKESGLHVNLSKSALCKKALECVGFG